MSSGVAKTIPKLACCVYSSIESQSAVSDVLLQIRKTIAQNQLENRHLEELRDTLLPHLMSGEIDVSAIDI